MSEPISTAEATERLGKLADAAGEFTTVHLHADARSIGLGFDTDETYAAWVSLLLDRLDNPPEPKLTRLGPALAVRRISGGWCGWSVTLERWYRDGEQVPAW